MKTVPVKTHYLEMLSPPGAAPSPLAVSSPSIPQGKVPGGTSEGAFGEPPAPPAARVEQVFRPSLDFYRELYDSVGRDWYWVNRLIMPDAELLEILEDSRVEVHVLRVDGKIAGYAELDRRVEGEIELAYFGLTPDQIGKGLGKYLLAWAVWRAWSYRPRRVWVHTCAWDHPRALGLYQKAGFRIYDEEFVDQAVVPDRPIPREHPSRGPGAS